MNKFYGILFFTFACLTTLSLDKPFENIREECLKLFRKVSLDKHNGYRKMHNSSNLEQDSATDDTAQKYADELAQTNIFEHSKDLWNVDENLFAKYSTERPILEKCRSNIRRI